MGLVKQSEFARMHRVSRKTVTLWKARGWLFCRGKYVDVEQSNALLKLYRRDGLPAANEGDNWVTNSGQSLPVTRLGNPQVTIPTPSDETPDHAAERISNSPAPYSLDEARRIKENYLALLHEFHYHQESATVVLVEEATKQLEASYADVRSRLLAIPAKHAQRILRATTVTEVQDLLWDAITGTLKELVQEAADRMRRTDTAEGSIRPSQDVAAMRIDLKSKSPHL